MKLKKLKKMSVLILTMVLISFMGTTVYAQELPDIDKDCSVSFTMLYGETTLVGGGNLTVYRVGEIFQNSGDYNFKPADNFVASGESFDDLSDKSLAKRLNDFAEQNSISALLTKEIDSNGNVKFDGLKTGLYLVVQDKASKGYKPIAPFLISLPYYDTVTKTYQYNLKIEPKTEIEKLPDTPSSVESPNLPQTGQLWWPIPLLICSGLTLCIIGVLLNRRKKSNEN